MWRQFISQMRTLHFYFSKPYNIGQINGKTGRFIQKPIIQ